MKKLLHRRLITPKMASLKMPLLIFDSPMVRSVKRDGKWIYYYENGNVWSEGFFKDGKSDGKRTTHYENGKIFYEGYYKDDRRVGVWKFYDEKGTLVKSVDHSKELEKGLKPSL